MTTYIVPDIGSYSEEFQLCASLFRYTRYHIPREKAIEPVETATEVSFTFHTPVSLVKITIPRDVHGQFQVEASRPYPFHHITVTGFENTLFLTPSLKGLFHLRCIGGGPLSEMISNLHSEAFLLKDPSGSPYKNCLNIGFGEEVGRFVFYCPQDNTLLVFDVGST